MSEVCGSRIPTKQEDDLAMRTAERMGRMGDTIRILNMEIAKNKAALAATSLRRKEAKDAVKVAGANREDLEGQLKSLESELSDQPDSKFEKIVVERMMKKNNEKMEIAAGELRAAVAELELIESTLEREQRQLSALNDEVQQLKFGGRPSGMQPWPLFYPSVSLKDCPTTYIAVTVCTLCAFPFPNHDIIVASCKHLYHPWCAMVVFGKGRSTSCVQRSCMGLVHPSWHQSFGWGIPAEELQQRAVQLNTDGESAHLQHQRDNYAKLNESDFGMSYFNSCFSVTFYVVNV